MTDARQRNYQIEIDCRRVRYGKIEIRETFVSKSLRIYRFFGWNIADGLAAVSGP